MKPDKTSTATSCYRRESSSTRSHLPTTGALGTNAAVGRKAKDAGRGPCGDVFKRRGSTRQSTEVRDIRLGHVLEYDDHRVGAFRAAALVGGGLRR